MTKLITILFAGVLVVFGLVAILSDSQSDTGNFNLTSDQKLTHQVGTSGLAIDSIQFFAWWWSDDQIAKGIDINNAPPKGNYIELERWQNLGDAEVPHPGLVDIVCSIRNRGQEPAHLRISATGDFRVTSYAFIGEWEKKNKTLDEVLETIPWSIHKDLGMQVIDRIAPGESKEVKFKDFDLQSVVDEFSAGRNDDLWPWRFRVRIEVKSSAGFVEVKSEKILNLIPGD